MNKDTQRLILASVLIFLVVILTKPIFEALGYSMDSQPEEVQEPRGKEQNENFNNDLDVLKTNESLDNDLSSSAIDTTSIQKANSIIENIEITIKTNLYTAIISNISGGTLVGVELNDYKKDNELMVELKPFDSNKYCNPCLKDNNGPITEFIYSDQDLVIDATTASRTLQFQYNKDNKSIIKNVTFYPNSYSIDHDYELKGNWDSSISLAWENGLQPTETNIQSDVIDAVGASIKPLNEGKETLRISGPGESASNADNNVLINQAIDWAAVQTKYFIVALIPDASSRPSQAKISGKSIDGFNDQRFVQSYDINLTYQNINKIQASIYLGPLDNSLLESVNPSLHNAIYWGWGFIQPIAKLVLWLLNTLHSIIPNYGICLIVFALIIQRITAPLTKKTYQSSQKMQEIQPLIKKIQEKHKNDSKKMNQEMMSLYKEKGVNPLGGCLPLLLQMPLLFAIFSVFRHTIELRGMPFIGWISDLSQPDIVFHLPFHIPLYGSHVAFLPILMGISIFLTQRLSMATMESSQKPMMYIMNGFFILIFNGFPSGLNLYYTVYNLLNYFQQKSIRTQS